MNLRDMIFWAYRQCRRRLFESSLIVLAIGLGIGVIVSVLALFNGVRIQQASYLSQPNYRTIRITSVEDISEVFANTTNPLVSIPEVMRADRIVFSLDDLTLLKQTLPGAYVFFQQTGSYRLESPAATQAQSTQSNWGGGRQDENSIQTILTTPDFFRFLELSATRGSLFEALDVTGANKVIVLGSGLAERIFADQNPIGQEIRLSGEEEAYIVMGVLAPTDLSSEASGVGRNLNQQAFIPITAAPRGINVRVANMGNMQGLMAQAQGFINQNPGLAAQAQEFMGGALGGRAAGGQQQDLLAQAQSLLNQFQGQTEMRIGLPQGSSLGGMLREIRQYSNMTYGDIVSIYAPFEALQAQQERFIFMGMIIALFASIGLLIAAVNILILMLARILRRTRSIGISRALGAGQKAIFAQFLVEATLLGVVGSFVGILLSYGGVRFVSMLVEEPISHSFMVQFMGILIALGVSLIFGVYPAYQGARINPVEALRSE